MNWAEAPRRLVLESTVRRFASSSIVLGRSSTTPVCAQTDAPVAHPEGSHPGCYELLFQDARNVNSLQGLGRGAGDLAVARFSPNELRYRSVDGAPRRSVSSRVRRLLWSWFRHESPILTALNALISVGILALTISLTPIGGERLHWPDSATLELYVGVAFLALAALAALRTRSSRRRSLTRRLFGSTRALAFALAGVWLLAVWFYESYSAWFYDSGILMVGGSLTRDLNYFDDTLVPLLAPTLAVLFGLVFSAKQLNSIRHAISKRRGKALALSGFIASACTLTIGAYAGDYRYFGDPWDLAGAAHSANSVNANSYEPLFAANVSCHISDGFGRRRNPFDGRLGEFHPGVDIAVAQGTPVHAMASGTVIFSGPDHDFGNIVAIRANDGSTKPPTVVAAHMQRVFVVTGSQVRGGDLIGLAGTTGRSTGPHVHVQLCVKPRTNRSGGFVCGGAQNPYESWRALSAIARSSCMRGPIV